MTPSFPAAAAGASAASALELVFRPDPTVFDGRFANNGWLQELPKPLSRLTWDNAIVLHPRTAARLGLGYRIGMRGGEVVSDVVELSYQGRSLRGPLWVLPGQPEDTITLHLGHGRTQAGRLGSDVGFSAYAVRTAASPWQGSGATLRRTGKSHVLAAVHLHYTVAGRDLLRAGTLAEYQRDPRYAQHRKPEPPRSLTLYPEWPYKGHAWGMSIDLNACVGCSACVVACQAENNIPVVGKQEVVRGREMHWLRIDRYYRGDLDNPLTDFMPVPCMHCEDAPCELVCPVDATVHDDEGLNTMVYNRCVGTRYCSNNCPYKVRRFNFFLYSDWVSQSLQLQRNPDVTVRSRGVMEKCTYCVQRINGARATAEREDRPLRDGEIRTACQAACPAQAIVFGDRNDPGSQLAQRKRSPRDYALLGELNTRPRTTYLAAVRNPNPALHEPGLEDEG